MARRLTIKHDAHTRDKIRTTQLVNALQEHALGRRKMDISRIRAAEILLRKVLPDMASIEHTGEVEHTYVARLPAPIPEADTWEQRYAPNPPTAIQ